MKLNSTLEKSKYAVAPFAVLALLSLIYDGFDNPVVLLIRMLLCLSAALFFFFATDKDNDAFIPSLAFLSIISCNMIFLTDDIHILLSLSCFLLSLIFTGKAAILSAVFAFLCVVAQPFAVLFFVPTIVIVQFFKKNKPESIAVALVSICAFILTKFLENTDFYADQFNSYHLAVHFVHFSNQHLEFLADFVVASIPLFAVLIFFVVSMFLKKNFVSGILTIVTALLCLYGFALSKNYHTVTLILIPVFAQIMIMSKSENLKDICNSFNTFCKKHLVLFLFAVVFVAAYPILFGQVPFDSDFFSRVTFIIFRQE